MPNLTKLFFIPPSGGPVDWTNYFIDMTPINRKIESDKPGEAGIIMFDTVSIEMPVSKLGAYFDEDTLFGGSAIPKYHIQIKKHIDGTDYQLFEGLIDIQSLKFTRHGTVQFDVYDKLSALKFYPTQPARERKEAIANDCAPGTAYLYAGWLSTQQPAFGFYQIAADHSTIILLTNTIFVRGDIIIHPKYWNESENKYDQEELFLTTFTAIRGDLIWNDITTSFSPEGHGNREVNKQYYYDYKFYGLDINLYTNYVLTAFNGLAMLEAIIKSAYPSITVVNRTGWSAFPISLGFFEQTINMPFDRPILEAIKYLASSMQVYVYIDRNGQFIIDKWPGFGTEPTLKPGISDYQTENDYKYTWDKLVDKVTIQTVAADGSKEEAVAGTEYKNPVNALERTVFASDLSAQQIADAYFNFYGKRHRARSITRKLDATVAQLDLTSWVDVGDKDFRDNSALYYFIDKMSFNVINDTVDLDLVSVKTFDL